MLELLEEVLFAQPVKPTVRSAIAPKNNCFLKFI
ncbi:hypothetical protein LGAS_0232 [Lactobacillus gasseri ATCC 33323 = JCM 1131]|uniref:Uncharacterized protein n=1 Tax=Lactobacillus gasseri (strain ATCC 33323 / DSM 20243 / BCRC 14619 / CIP 102991 / JCM 1131 / KCTC 3163 / NCIMB 11718 / NCTC 13722 / AM63) TaxID=324831 RepID=A0A806A4E5_LACGA|nr:hypothetical protein LGAS_0232 [Lactobacillus gasseri ATCC 33323 = JCM 1131]